MNSEIITAAELCLLSYQDPPPTFFTCVGDLCYGVVEKNSQRYIIIRGTANAKNWLRDADAIPRRTCGGYLAHSGFVEAYRRLCSGGMPTVKGPNVIATGHSLGGGVATLLAEHIGCRLITFGSPRVYLRWWKWPTLDHVRVANDDDPVTMIPRVLYSHKNDPLILKDGDHQIIDVADHSMVVYLERLKKRQEAEILTAP